MTEYLTLHYILPAISGAALLYMVLRAILTDRFSDPDVEKLHLIGGLVVVFVAGGWWVLL